MNVRSLVPATLAIVGLTAAPSRAAAHCDSMDGPVVKAAEQALRSGTIDLVLVWVRPQDEPEIRQAFARTMTVRRLGGEAQALADYWFFETLVRVHRAGEGEPYTGLKPSGYETPAGIAAADRALELGKADALLEAFTGHLGEALHERFAQVQALRAYDPGDVEAGRRYVHAYVEYIHFVERLHSVIHGEGADVHGETRTTGVHDH